MVEHAHPRQAGRRLAVKILFDRLSALLALLLLSPVLAVVSLVILISMGAPVFFTQTRPGRWGRPFRVIKFRTMGNQRGPDGTLLPDADRLSGLGRLIRSTSLDELPQLWNVLRGDISLVGPRPLLMQYLPRYTEDQARRHHVLPGITGWAQINGRNALTWDEKFALDLWYVDHWSLSLDLRIIFLTMVKVFRREGVSQDGHVTMPEFMGSAEGTTGAASGMVSASTEGGGIAPAHDDGDMSGNQRKG